MSHYDHTQGRLSFNLTVGKKVQVELPFDIDYTHYSKPAGYNSLKAGPFLKEILVRNTGQDCLQEVFIVVNGIDWRAPETLLDHLSSPVSRDHYIKTLFMWWKDHIGFCQQDWLALKLFCLAQGCGSAEAQSLVFTDILEKQRVSARPVALSGHSCFEYFHGGAWHVVDPTRNVFYLHLDNKTLASAQDVFDDPFIAIRTHCFGKYGKVDIARSWRSFSQFKTLGAVVEPPFATDFGHLQRGLELYPGETLRYCLDRSSLGCSCVYPLEQLIKVPLRWKAGGHFRFRSLFPIYKIRNLSCEVLTITDEDVSLKPGETFDFSALPPFHLEFYCQRPEGEFIIETSCSYFAAPLLKRGENTLELRASHVQSSQLQIEHVFDLNQVNTVLPVLKVLNQSALFDHISPRFDIQASSAEMELIWWRIRPDTELPCPAPNHDRIEPYTDTIVLDRLSETFLSNGCSYLLEVRGYQDGVWGDWSIPFAFAIKKPEGVQEVSFTKVRDKRYTLSWKPETNEAVVYHIFGSNSIDFVPDVYFGKRIDKILGEDVVEVVDEENLVHSTKECSLTVNGDLAFYRIIVEHRNHLSVPSPIVRVYDSFLPERRDVLRGRLRESGQFVAERVSFPEPYDWAHNPGISEETRVKTAPYLLPANHPSKGRVDRLFRSARIVASKDAWYSAGFRVADQGIAEEGMIIGQHEDLPYWVIKGFLDDKQPRHWHYWYEHVIATVNIRLHIGKMVLKGIRVPEKWLYLLPSQPLLEADNDGHHNPFILVVDKVDLLSAEDNEKAFKELMTTNLLEDLASIIALGLSRANATRLRFCVDGSLAIIDTGECLQGPWQADFESVSDLLSNEMQELWQKIVFDERRRSGVYSGIVEKSCGLTAAAPLDEACFKGVQLVLAAKSKKALDALQARELLENVVTTLLPKVNSNPEGENPSFTPQNIGIELRFDSEHLDAISMLRLIQGQVLYYTGQELVREEHYER